MENKKLLWWGRYGNYGPDYPRNRTVLNCLAELGWQYTAFQPHISALAYPEALLHQFSNIEAVWVPCFRQRDIAAAAHWAKKNHCPLIIDPLISAYDKRVNERNKFPAQSLRAKRLLKWESKLFNLADWVIADTSCHKEYFINQLGCQPNKVEVIPVSAEESLFFPEKKQAEQKPDVLFFGTFIGLQGATHIAEAIQHYQGPAITLTFLGDGPDLNACKQSVTRQNNPLVEVNFESWIAFKDLPARIRKAQLCLGVFGTGEKTRRVIPNKVYQALACGIPVLTMPSAAFPNELLNDETLSSANGIYWAKAGDAQDIAKKIAQVVSIPPTAHHPHAGYQRYFSNQLIKNKLSSILGRD